MIKQHYFYWMRAYPNTYTIKHKEGDFHIFIIQHPSQEGSLYNAPSDQPQQFEAWVSTQPMELVYRSPYKIVNYRDQKLGARLEMLIYRSTKTKESV